MDQLVLIDTALAKSSLQTLPFYKRLIPELLIILAYIRISNTTAVIAVVAQLNLC